MDREYPSDEFQQAWGTERTCISITCQLCGREHFTSGPGCGSYEDGEMEKLQQLAMEQPNKYVEDTEYGSIDFGYFEGKQAVVHCPCCRLVPVEKFVWANRREILAYLRLRSDRERKDSQRNVEDYARTSAVCRTLTAEAARKGGDDEST